VGSFLKEKNSIFSEENIFGRTNAWHADCRVSLERRKPDDEVPKETIRV
jgi:hypothetical protein